LEKNQNQSVMKVDELKKWLQMVSDHVEVCYVVYGEQGRSNAYLIVKGVNVEWHLGKVVVVLHPDEIEFHKGIKL
jgi:hypothetical protein